jgi:hypothetical protein
VLKYFSVTPPENSGDAENSTEYSGPHAKIVFCYMYELSQRHPVWVAEINVTACNSVSVIENQRFGLVFEKTGSIISGTGRFFLSV